MVERSVCRWFQQQVMQISILAAGFTPGEADGLRRAMAAWKRKGGLKHYYDKIVVGMTDRGYDRGFAVRADQGLLGVWISREPRSELRATGLCQLLAQMPSIRRSFWRRW